MKLKPLGANQNEVTLADGTVILFSYETPVAATQNGMAYRTEKHWSRTTSKHINRWLQGWPGARSMPQSFFDQLGRGA